MTAIAVCQCIAQSFGLGSGPIYAAFPYKNITTIIIIIIIIIIITTNATITSTTLILCEALHSSLTDLSDGGSCFPRNVHVYLPT